MFSLDDARLFARVVEHGGFSAAARAGGQPKSTLSKRVAALERQLGARLLHRNTRGFALTEVGAAFHRHVAALLIEAEAAEAEVKGRLAEPSGVVRLTASIITAQHHLAVVLPEIAAALPKVQILLHATDRKVDLVQEGFDLALRDHLDPLPASDLLQRRLGAEPDFLVAAPGYLARAGRPAVPPDLIAHQGLLNGAPAKPMAWRLRTAAGALCEATPMPRFFADDPVTLVGMALAGFGIACLPRCVAAEPLREGRLERVLPDWVASGATTTLLVPHRRGQLPAVRALMNAFVRTLGPRLEG